MNARTGFLVHGDDLAGAEDVDAVGHAVGQASEDPGFVADEQDPTADVTHGLARALDDRARRMIAPHRVDGNDDGHRRATRRR